MYSSTNDHIIAGRYHLHEHVSSDIFSDMYEATDMLRKASVHLRFFNEVWMDHVSSSEDLIQTKDSISEMLQPYHLKIKDWRIGSQYTFVMYPYSTLTSLENLLDEEEDKLELADAVFICLELCRGLEKSYYEFGLPHLALGPKNVFITGDGRIKFQDYGVSAYIQKEHFYSQVRSLHEYLVPEAFFQWKIEDFRSDFYLLSCLLYRMITGRNPQAKFSPVRPSDFELYFSIPERRSLGRKFLRIFELMSSPDPEDRFSSHDALINALSSYLNSNTGSRNRRLTTFENLDFDFSQLS